MKKTLIHFLYRPLSAVVLVLVMAAGAVAQQRNADGSPIATKKKQEIGRSYAWKLLSPLGLREEADMDTLSLNLYRRSVPSMVSDAYVTTGNLGAEGLNMIFHERKPMSDFFFADALEHWMPTHDKMRFYNTRIPMTIVDFSTAGSRDNTQEWLKGTFSGNINKRAQVGAFLDFIYSKGCYNSQATKDLSWGLSGSYMGDRYEMQAYFNNYNLLNKENGGITDMLYITDPAELQGGVTSVDPKAIPTNLNDAHTRLRGTELYVNNRYKVGYWHEEAVDDTTTRRTYIPVSSFIYTLRFNSDKHLFVDGMSSETSKFFEHTYLNPDFTRDETSYWALTNTVGVSLLEGFHKYAKFGLAAYVTHQMRHYTFTPDTLDRANLALTPFPEGVGTFDPKATQQLMWVGAQLTKQKGSLIRYAATAELGFVGDVAGDLKVDGELSARFKFLGDSVDIKAFGRFHNTASPLLMQRYISNHFIWKNNFGKQRDVSFGGQLNLGRTGTNFRVSLTNLQNHIYLGADGLPRQHGGSVQVLSLSLKQKLRFGIWNWENSITYQTSTDDNVLPLPKLAVYSNMYLLFRVATLNVQFGIDCDYYTRYYAPLYQPALASFANQRENMVGNYPFCNAYLNMKLSRARFFVMYSHANKGLFGGDNYFSMPYYPLNPARLQLGISVDFLN